MSDTTAATTYSKTDGLVTSTRHRTSRDQRRTNIILQGRTKLPITSLQRVSLDIVHKAINSLGPIDT